MANPFGCLGQGEETSARMEDAVWPQYLHVYEDLSDPSYALCLPLAKPSGCFGHGELTRALTDLAVCPQ